MSVKNKSKDFILGIIMVFFGVVLMLLTLRLENTFSQLFDSRFLPLMMSVIMILLGVLQMLFHRKDVAEVKEKKDNKTLLITFILLLGYIFSYLKLGFIVSSIIFIFLEILNLTPKNVKPNMILYTAISIIIPVVVYYLFYYGFKIMLPLGILKNIL